MEFGIFSNGFRPHTTAAQTYEEDLQELILADRLGFSSAWISEHHGEPVYINKVDTCPVPELLMAKAAGLTKQIRMGAAINVIHLHHPVDTAIKAATCDHMLNGRYMFGFGSGFPNPMFAQERGLAFEDRHERLLEALELIIRCWTTEQPFDYEGKHYRGKGIVTLPKPVRPPHMPIGTATETDATLQLAGERGYMLLAAQLDGPAGIRRRADKYMAAAAKTGKSAGPSHPLANLFAARSIWVTDSVEQAKKDLRDAVNHEIRFQKARGLTNIVKRLMNLPDGVEISFDLFYEAGMYYIGDPDTVAEKLKGFWDQVGGVGTLMYVAGKDWATREKRHRSMRLFMEQVAPQLRHLEPTRQLEAKAA
jgi:limonene 1,2-monooxygenase